MKILLISPFFPYPPDNGFRIRVYNLIKVLASSHQISLFSLIQSPDEVDYSQHLKEFCDEVWPVLPGAKLPGAFDGRREPKDVLLGIADKSPKRLYGSPSHNVVSHLEQTLRKGEYDIVIVESIFMSNYLWDILPLKRTPTVLVEHNIETLIQKQQIKIAVSLPLKLRKWLYYATFRGFESRACQKYDGIVVMSEVDRQLLLKNNTALNKKCLAVVPNGVDLSWYSNIEFSPKPNTLIYNGALSYDANYDAMAFFLAEIYPYIRQARPEVNLSITGRTDGVNLREFSREPGIYFTGYLEDIRPAIAQSWACVVPLRVGGGTRLKILEALALGTPVISTSKGAEGLDLIPGRDILIADEPIQFANLVINLLEDSKLRETLSANGKKAVSTNYDWQILGKKFNDFINLTINQARERISMRGTGM